ncbi:mlo-like protein 5 [Phtheirospermum japonicum]|uniref:MLO-like protein n=1 Tax=Phtheirospermum japonicum TaxID=374723 RepID=A0A830B2R3_9LAMI|nr:mlo-like protein 5 [Phtheirospermum japonicum]
MAGGNGEGSRELDQTPTWAVSLVCSIIIIISILLEKTLHIVAGTFSRRKKFALLQALEKIKAELMILGFISLILTFGQNYITRICISERFANTMLPCNLKTPHSHGNEEDDHHRRLLWDQVRRILAADHPAKECKKGFVPLISVHGLHQLHIFIFFLAVFHVMYSAATMRLGRMKIREWKEWERESEHVTKEMDDPSNFRLTHETSFVKGHNSLWARQPVLFHVGCFFRHMFRSVRRADYLTLRHGFISVHLAPGTKFNFQKYIKRSLEDDFKEIVGIHPVLWFAAVVYLLVNVKGWQAMFWLSITPLMILLAVGTKLQSIITKMAIEIQERHVMVQGIPLVQVSDSHFWFSWPEFILHLIHLVLFQNAFEITYFIWITYEFGLHSCYHSYFILAVIRVWIGIGVQFLCSYITLPLYALVTQMGSHMKTAIFDEQTSRALKKWHKQVKKRKESVRPRSRKSGELTNEESVKRSSDPDIEATDQLSIEVADNQSTNEHIHGEYTAPSDQSAGQKDLLTGP